MTGLRIVLCMAALGAASASPAAELMSSLKVGGDWNYLSRSGDTEVPAFLVRPALRLKSDTSDLTYDVSYQPIWRYYLDDRGGKEWNHDVRASGSWRASQKTVLSMSDRFLRTESPFLFNELVGGTDPSQPADDQLRLAVDQRRVKNNLLRAGLEHQFSGATFLSANFSHNWFEEESRTTTAFAASLALDRSLTARNRVGGGFSVSRNTSQTLDAEERGTTFLGLNGSWVYSVDPTLQLSVSAGPSLILQDDPPDLPTVFPGTPRFPLLPDGEGGFLPLDAASCPTLPDGTTYLDESCEGLPPPLLSDATAAQVASELVDLPLVGEPPQADDQSLTWFANMSLSKRWQKVSAALSYRRGASTTSSLGTSTIDDILTGSLLWEPDRKWRVTFSASYRRQTRDTNRLRALQLVREGTITETLVFDFFGTPIAIPSSRPGGERFGVGFVTVDDSLQSDTVAVRLHVGYRLTERVSLEATGFYNYDSLGLRSPHFVRFAFGVQYAFKSVYL